MCVVFFLSQVVPGGLPRNVEAAVQRYGSATYSKAPAATVLDPNGKLSLSLTYGKLLSRSMKIAHALLSSQVRGETNWVFCHAPIFFPTGQLCAVGARNLEKKCLSFHGYLT